MLTSGTVTTRIDGLEERGFVQRRPDLDDRRAVRVRLTRAGLRTIDEAIGARMDSANEQLSALPEAERRALSETLRKLLTDSTAERRAA